MSRSHQELLRTRAPGAAGVRPIELFFDLVYVLAITQLTHHLLEHLTWRGAGETLLLLVAVWSAWNATSWTINYFDPDALPVRVMLLGVMLASLIASASIPEAFGDRGLAFAAAYVAIQVGRSLFVVLVLGRVHALGIVFKRALAWWSVTGVIWVAGGFAEGDARLALWLAALAVEVVVVWLGFPFPGLGRTSTSDYTIAGEHMAERAQLFVLLALGESIIVTGTTFGELPGSAVAVAAFVVAFVGSVALWWIYFDRGAEAGRQVISEAENPGQLGLTAYTFFHIPIGAGVIVAAAGDELALAHPRADATVASAAVILGGPALYLAGNALFKWALWDYVPRSRFVAIAALAALVPAATVLSVLPLLVAATVVVVAVAWADRRPYVEAR